MLIQIGDRIYEGVLAPTSWSQTGGDALLAQHQLINGKARIQHTGQALEELSLTLSLRPDYCVIADELDFLEEAKANGTILPLLVGNGDYKSDYVIQSTTKTVLQMLSDGTPTEVEVQVVLLEYIPYSKEELQEKENRKNAIAVGDKNTGATLRQKKTPESEAHTLLMQGMVESWNAQNLAESAAQASNPADFADKVQKQVDKAQAAMTKAREAVQSVQAGINGGLSIVNSVTQAITSLGSLGAVFNPPVTTTNILNGIDDLKVSLAGVSFSSNPFMKSVILRRF